MNKTYKNNHRKIVPRRRYRTHVPPGYEFVDLSIGPKEEIYCLYSEPIERWDPDYYSLPLVSVPSHSYQCEILSNNRSRIWELGQFNQPLSHIQPLKKDLLLVNSRCRHISPNEQDKNAILVDYMGNIKRSFILGDGLNSVQVSGDGSIWCSYSDEGVYGNFGWGEDGIDPIGSSGLVCFDHFGNKLYEYEPPGSSGEEIDLSITDCYVMNVLNDETWIIPYTDFPILNIKDKKVENWWFPAIKDSEWGSYPMYGMSSARVTKAACYENKMLLLSESNFYLVDLFEDRKSNILHSYSLDIPGKKWEYINARGSVFYIYMNGWIYTLDLKDLI